MRVILSLKALTGVNHLCGNIYSVPDGTGTVWRMFRDHMRVPALKVDSLRSNAAYSTYALFRLSAERR